ncbi:HlyD family secretion protein [Bradyrhizobium liaoningense]
MSNNKLISLAAFGVLGLAAAFAPSLLLTRAREFVPVPGAAPDTKTWQAVAPGRVEPWSEQVRIGAPVPGRVAEVLVTINDTVFAGEALIRIDNIEVRTNLAKVEAEVNLRMRGRANPPPPKDARRRHVEDAAADQAQVVVEARSAVDRAEAARRAGTGSDDALKAAIAALSKAREQLTQRQTELARFEADTPSVVPTELEAKLAMARIDLRGAQAALDNLTIRAPISGTVLQLGVRAGEVASPAVPQPLLVLGDLSRLRVRAELDQRDVDLIKPGQPVLVRSAAFAGRDFTGKVSSIAPIIRPGSFGTRGQGSFSDIDVAEVLVELAEPGPLIVGMKVDVYFRDNKL